MSNFASPCRDFPPQSWLLLSGELPEAEKQFWQRHLQDCALCQETLATARSVQAQYASLPLYDAPERVIQKLARQSKPRAEEAGWLAALDRFFSSLSNRLEYKPRLALAGVALAVFLLAGFHYFAFRPRLQHTWEAAAFERKASELLNALDQNEAGAAEEMWSEEDAGFADDPLDQQVSSLRESLAALSSDPLIMQKPLMPCPISLC